MAKYKVGDKVRIVSERPDSRSYVDEMVRFLGKEITISEVRKELGIAYYYSEDAKPEDPIQKHFCKCFGVPGYFFRDEWISGLAEPERVSSIHECRNEAGNPPHNGSDRHFSQHPGTLLFGLLPVVPIGQNFGKRVKCGVILAGGNEFLNDLQELLDILRVPPPSSRAY